MSQSDTGGSIIFEDNNATALGYVSMAMNVNPSTVSNFQVVTKREERKGIPLTYK